MHRQIRGWNVQQQTPFTRKIIKFDYTKELEWIHLCLLQWDWSLLDQIEALLTSYAHYKDDNSKRFDFQDYLMSNDDEEKTLFLNPLWLIIARFLLNSLICMLYIPYLYLISCIYDENNHYSSVLLSYGHQESSSFPAKFPPFPWFFSSFSPHLLLLHFVQLCSVEHSFEGSKSWIWRERLVHLFVFLPLCRMIGSIIITVFSFFEGRFAWYPRFSPCFLLFVFHIIQPSFFFYRRIWTSITPHRSYLMSSNTIVYARTLHMSFSPWRRPISRFPRLSFLFQETSSLFWPFLTIDNWRYHGTSCCCNWLLQRLAAIDFPIWHLATAYYLWSCPSSSAPRSIL